MAFVGGRVDGKLCDLMQKLIDAEVVPPEVRRVIIDIPLNEPVRVLYDCFGVEEMVNHSDLIKAILESQPIVKDAKGT